VGRLRIQVPLKTNFMRKSPRHIEPDRARMLPGHQQPERIPAAGSGSCALGGNLRAERSRRRPKETHFGGRSRQHPQSASGHKPASPGRHDHERAWTGPRAQPPHTASRPGPHHHPAYAPLRLPAVLPEPVRDDDLVRDRPGQESSPPCRSARFPSRAQMLGPLSPSTGRRSAVSAVPARDQLGGLNRATSTGPPTASAASRRRTRA